MSGWLNFNESLNTLKGQISTFANNVLAENDEGTEPAETNLEELKNLYIQKETEIENLKKINEELQRCLRISGNTNGETNENNWDWTTPELTVDGKNTEKNDSDVSDLKQVIKQLENEKRDLLNQLDQLDAENQQNLAELMGIRDHLQDENNDLKEKCQQLKQQNKNIASKEERLTHQVEELKNQLKELRSASIPSIDSNENHDSLVKSNQELKLKLEETTKELTVLRSTHETLEKTINDIKNSGEKELSELVEKLKKSELENKTIHSELQKAKEHAKISEQKIQEDAENCQKLAFILESYEKQVSSLKEELDKVKNKRNTEKAKLKNVEVMEKSNQDLQTQLEKALQRISSLENESKSNSELENTISKLNSESNDLRRELEEKCEEIDVLKGKLNDNIGTDLHDRNLKEIDRLSKQLEEISLEKENLHKVYVNIITDNVKRYIDSATIPSVQYENPHVLEFSKQVEDIFKILVDYKEKCELFEKDVLKISKEKTQLLNEKNDEIEKLIQNSEVLSQDVINKSETVKELEAEISNLMSTNDVLMSELDSYKNAGLQTISESNEDNMVLLETDLENANKRIRELEQIIDGGAKSTVSHDSSNTSLEGKISEKLEDYQELLNSFDYLKIDYDTVKKDLSLYQTENEDLKIQIEKIRADYENIDYQLSEANFQLDSLQDEFESNKSKLNELIHENKELKLQSMNNIDLKSEFNEIKEKWLTEANSRRELESEVKNLKEKLQNSKVTETSLKLQYDTLSKEHVLATEAKNNAEKSLIGAQEKITEYENNYTELLQKYDDVLLRCEELNTQLHEKDKEILKLQHAYKVVEEQNQELEKILEEKSNQLQQYLVQQDTVNEDLSNISKLRAQVQEQGDKITEFAKMLRDEEEKKKELETIVDKQTKEIQGFVDNEASAKEDFEKKICSADKKIEDLSNALKESQQEIENLRNILSNKDIDQQRHIIETETVTKENSELLLQENQRLHEEINNLQLSLKDTQDSLANMQQQMLELTNSRNELINMVTVKHQESLNYHNELQRLTQILKSENEKYSQLEAQLIQASTASQEIAKKSEENDKLIDENNFLKEKCDILAKNLLEEQSKLQQALAEKSGPSEKEIALSKKLERLQSHLVELEEHYTQELLQAEQKNAELQAKVSSLEQREKNSNTLYTSVSIRANQQVETLQNQLQLVTNQRDELRRKISDAEDANNKQAAALANLQFVLEQFQKDKEKDVLKETERIRRQINVEKQVQDSLRKEIENLKEQLEESKIGLQAASRLSDQLEAIKKLNSGLKEEVSQLHQKLAKSQQTIHNLTSQTDGKIDKCLIKNLVIGLLSSGNTHNWNKDQAQILKIIATVLDFNQQDHDKVKLNQPQQGSWLGSILFPQASNQNMSQESLSKAFVKFLENESKPRVVPSLLSDQSSRPSNSSTESSRKTTPRASPIVLNEIVLPTFADFGQSRNSSSILKDVMKDNNNS